MQEENKNFIQQEENKNFIQEELNESSNMAQRVINNILNLED